MPLNAEDAIEACADRFEQPLPTGHRLVAHALPGTELWSVNAVENRGMPYPGSFLIVGPDGQVWPFSSNPGIHDAGLVVSVLSDLYRRALTRFVEPERLAARVRDLTEERADRFRALIHEAEAGQLRTPRPRQLP